MKATRWYGVRACSGLMCAAAAVLGISDRLHAKPPGFEALDVVLTRDIWQTACTELALGEEQQKLAQQVLTAYWEAVSELDRRAHQRILDAGLRELLAAQEARRANSPLRDFSLSPEEQREAWKKQQAEYTQLHQELQFGIQSARVAGYCESDQLRDVMLFDLQTAIDLEPEQVVQLGRIIRRESLLRPESLRNDRRLDFSGTMDLFDLVQQASGADGEITQLRAALLARQADDEPAESRLLGIDETLALYELRIDAQLLEQMARLRKQPRQDDQHVWEAGDPEIEKRRREGRERWRARYDAFAFGVEMIRLQIAENAGEEAAAAWQRRADASIAPRLTGQYFMDGIERWIEVVPTLTPEQIEGIMAIKTQYLIEREPMMRKMVQAGVQMMRRDGNAHGNSPAQVAYARAQVEFAKMQVRKIKAIKAIVTPDQYKDLKFTVYVDGFAPILPDINAEAMRELNVPEDDLSIGPMEDEWFGKPYTPRFPGPPPN